MTVTKAWALCQTVFLIHWLLMGSVLGGYDVDTYLGGELIGVRHWLIGAVNDTVGGSGLFWTFAVPALFFFGIMEPTCRLFGERGAWWVFFGTTLFFQLVLMARWSQMLSIALLMWAAVVFTLMWRHLLRVMAAAVLLALSCMYLPGAGVIFTLWMPSSLFVAVWTAYAWLFPQGFSFGIETRGWHPALSLLFFYPPYLYHVMRRSILKFSVLSLTDFGRGLVYLMLRPPPQLADEGRPWCIAWWCLMALLWTLSCCW